LRGTFDSKKGFQGYSSLSFDDGSTLVLSWKGSTSVVPPGGKLEGMRVHLNMPRELVVLKESRGAEPSLARSLTGMKIIRPKVLLIMILMEPILYLLRKPSNDCKMANRSSY